MYTEKLTRKPAIKLIRRSSLYTEKCNFLVNFLAGLRSLKMEEREREIVLIDLTMVNPTGKIILHMS